MQTKYYNFCFFNPYCCSTRDHKTHKSNQPDKIPTKNPYKKTDAKSLNI